jgi:hypothetical protein
MKLNSFLLLISLFLVLSCRQKPSENKLDSETYARYLAAGHEVSGTAQAALLANVSRAMQQGGSLYAIEFCNLHAAGITDSLSRKWNCDIARISEKNRNPENGLKTDTDKQMWDYFFALHRNGAQHDTIVALEGQPVYYRPIIAGMPACLQCHGSPQETDPATYSKIRELYPSDLAMGYNLNDFRGLWKISFAREP